MVKASFWYNLKFKIKKDFVLWMVNKFDDQIFL